MRKRFVRLAIVAVVVLVAFLMYRSTEGFTNQPVNITTIDRKCTYFLGTETRAGYVCRIGKQNRDPKKVSLNIYNNPAAPVCNADKGYVLKPNSGWGSCNNLVSPSQGRVPITRDMLNNTNSKCYECVYSPSTLPSSASKRTGSR